MRVKKIAGGTTTTYIFSGAKLIQEYTNGTLLKQHVYAGNQRLATLDSSNAVLAYDHPDHPSLRVQTDASGSDIGQYGHAPFGETWYEPASPDRMKFTTYDRDSVAGLDYATFRWYSRRMGRFVTPDLLAGDGRLPQSINRFAYVINDPTNLVDPLGLRWFCYTDVTYRQVAWADDGGHDEWIREERTVCEWFDTSPLQGPEIDPGGRELNRRRQQTFDRCIAAAKKQRDVEVRAAHVTILAGGTLTVGLLVTARYMSKAAVGSGTLSGTGLHEALNRTIAAASAGVIAMQQGAIDKLNALDKYDEAYRLCLQQSGYPVGR